MSAGPPGGDPPTGQVLRELQVMQDKMQTMSAEEASTQKNTDRLIDINLRNAALIKELKSCRRSQRQDPTTGALLRLMAPQVQLIGDPVDKISSFYAF